jgi:hypothetical protein
MAQIGHLSGSTDGAGIKIAATSSAGTTLHTAISETDQIDRVWLYLYNSHSSDVEVTFEIGGTTSPDNHVVLTVPADDGLYLALDGLPIQNSKTIAAFAGTTNVVIAYGHVLRGTADEAFN